MNVTIDAATLSPMLGRTDVYNALLDGLNERRGDHESAGVLRLRLRRAVQGGPLNVRIVNAGKRVPAELAFIERTLRDLHPGPTMAVQAEPAVAA